MCKTATARPGSLPGSAARLPGCDVFADWGHAGPKPRDALIGIWRWTVQIVKRSETVKGFEVLPRRCVVERTFAWLGKCRRLAMDWERTRDCPDFCLNRPGFTGG